MPEHSDTARSVPCPACGAPVEWNAQRRWRPFCSERCRLIDLGQWLDGSHSIAGDAATATAADEDHRP